jgi:ribonuclease Z
MSLLFLGTGSQKPSKTRNVTSIALILRSGHFILFDCGEGTQHQII